MNVITGAGSCRLVLALICINVAMAVVTLSGALWNEVEMPASAQAPGVIRAQSIELVDGSGQIRSRLNVESGGEVVLRLMDQNGTIRVKLGASADGSGLLLTDETTEPGVHIISRRSGSTLKPTTTSITLRGEAGKTRVISP